METQSVQTDVNGKHHLPNLISRGGLTSQEIEKAEKEADLKGCIHVFYLFNVDVSL